jgi:hypothetical protein
MSDPYLTMQRQIQAQSDQLEPLRKADVTPLFLPWCQRTLNPFPLASSGGVWGDQVLPWEGYILAFYASVFVNTTNNGTNFWTLALKDSAGTTLASVTTSAIAAGAFARLSSVSITQAASTAPELNLVATATLSPGSIFIVPGVALLRVGN